MNEYRPSVIMAPVARKHRGSSVTHFPLRMQVNYKINEGHITPTPPYGKDFCIPSAISSGYGMMSLNGTEQLSMAVTAGLINMVVRMRKVLAIRQNWYVCFSAEIGIIQYHRGHL